MSKHALRSSAQKESKFGLNISNDNKKMNAYKGNDTPNRMAGKNGEKQQEIDKIDEMFDMIKAVMKKLDTLEEIKQRIVCVERELIDVKNSIEFAHAEVKELKEEVEKVKRSDEENKEKIHALEEANQHLLDTVIDLKARSMRDNLLFHNVPEDEKENTSDKIYKILEENLQISDAREKIKIDRSHRVGRKRDSNRKPRAIVVKFNYFQDREHIRMNARKLRGTRIGIAEQFPEEIEKIRQTLYPEMKKAKAQGHRVRMVRDRLYINNVEFKHST